MRTLSLFCAAATLFVAVPALAAPCSTTVSLGVQSHFEQMELGQSPDRKAVIEGSTTLSCGNFSYNLFTIAEASTKGKYGERSFGDENDLTVSYAHTLATKATGPIDLQFSAAYFKYSPFKTADSTLVLSAEAARSYTHGTITVTPFLHAGQYVGFGLVPSVTHVRPGLRVATPLSSRWTAQTEIGHSFNFFKKGEPFLPASMATLDQDVPVRRSVSYVSTTLARDMGNGWSTTFLTWFMTRGLPVFGASVSKKF